MGSWHAVYIVCILESYKLISKPYLTSGTLKNWSTEPITQGLVRPCTIVRTSYVHASQIGQGRHKTHPPPFPAHFCSLSCFSFLFAESVRICIGRREGRPEIEHTHAIFEQFMNLSGPSSTLFFPIAQREEVSHRRLRLRPPLVSRGGEGSRKGQKRQFRRQDGREK